jgi:hypothetical protein
MKIIDDWYKEKVNSQYLTLISAIEVHEEYRVHTGGRSIYGEVIIVAEPNSVFQFTSHVEWPDKKNEDVYNKKILHGLIDVLFTYTDTPILGLSVILNKIGWDDIDSCAIGYYKAARIAAKKILRPANDKWNYE